ncbi:MAG: hypothetical protein ABSG53_23920, partial [Thermoguttaceae bacterium]
CGTGVGGRLLGSSAPGPEVDGRYRPVAAAWIADGIPLTKSPTLTGSDCDRRNAFGHVDERRQRHNYAGRILIRKPMGNKRDRNRLDSGFPAADAAHILQVFSADRDESK